MRLLVAQFVLLCTVPALAVAQDLEPSSLPPLDPEVVAHIVLSDEGTGADRRYAVDGRFAGDLNGDGLPDIVLPGAVEGALHLVFGSTAIDATEQDRRDGAGDATLLLPDGCRDGDERIRWAALGDINGDDRIDLGVACVTWSDVVDNTPYAGAGVVFLGRANWPSTVTVPDVVILGDALVMAGDPPMPIAGTRPGADIAGLGDLDGDGRDEFALSGFDVEDPFRPTAWVMPGAADVTGYDSVSDAVWRLRGETGAECVAPLFLAGLGDIDGDTIPDFSTACVVQPSGATIDIDLSVWLGSDLVALPDGDIDFSTRSFLIRPSDDLEPYPSALSRLGDLDGDGIDEFTVTSFIDGLSSVSGRIVQGHGGPWGDFGFFDTYWLEQKGVVDPYSAWLPNGSYDSADGLQMAPAGDLTGDGFVDLWVRQGVSANAEVGLLSSPRPATWADGSIAPLQVHIGTPGGVQIDDDFRFGLGGAGDLNGDGVLDLLVTSGYADDGGCTPDLCGAAYVILCVDGDGDGVGLCDGDCDDSDESVLPGALEVCDEIDHDCDANDGSVDGDGDGVLVCDGDCDDTDPLRFPGAEETCDSVSDLDCDGLAPGDDQDGDGSLNCEDCQPFLSAIAPGNVEVCDGLDSNCDGIPLPDEIDVDQDGFRLCSISGEPVDCDDLNPLIRPLRFEDCFNGIDDDCDGTIDVRTDTDGDGVSTCDGDCDDGNSDVFPGHTEDCDGLDNNCNGVIDDDRDEDGDGFGECAGDCDDRDPLRFPGNVGQCDPESDADCSGTSDIMDSDGDGFSACAGDCAEGDPGISPGVFDYCDGIDNDCDGVVDAPFDLDLDGWATCLGDCRDDVQLTHPQVVEPACDDARDGDCDGLTDEADPDCAEEATPPPPEQRPYGLSCTNAVVGQGSSAFGFVLLVLLVLRRRRTAVWLPLIALCLPLPAHAAKKEQALIVYISGQPDLAAMQDAKMAVPKVHAAELLHSSELLPSAEGLTALGARRVLLCAVRPVGLGMSATDALDALIELDYKKTVLVADRALAALPCVDREVPARLLPDLYYYRGLAKASMGRSDADADFAQVVSLAPKYQADPNFDPKANARLEAARRASAGSEVDVAAFVLPGGRLRLDGRDIDPTAESTPLRPGVHIAQIRAGRTTNSIVFEVAEETPVVVIMAKDRVRALRDAPVSPGARAYARAELSDSALTAQVDLAVLVDMDVDAESVRYFFRPSTGRFSFESGWGTEVGAANSGTAGSARASGSSSGGSTRQVAQGGSMVVDSESKSKKTHRPGTRAVAVGGGTSIGAVPASGSVLRLRVSGGFALTRPFPYVQIPIDVGVRIVKGLHIDLQVAVAHPGKLETGGTVWLPTAALGASYRIQVPVLEPRFGAAFQVGLDDSQGSVAPLPGWYGLAGVDVLVPGTRLLVGLDVRAGMLGKPFFLGVSAGLGVAL